MDTNDKIVGTVLGLNEKEYRSLVKDGMSKNKAALIAAESALIFHADSEKHEIVDLTNFTTDEKREFVKQYFNNTEIENCSYFDGDPRLIDSQNRVENHLEYLPIEVREEITNRVKKEEKAKAKAEAKGTAAKVVAGGLAGAILVGLGAYGHSVLGKNKEDEMPLEEQTAIEMQLKDESLPENWEAYSLNSMDTTQKQLFTNSYDWLTSVNAQESWEKVTLTEEKMKEYGYTDSECLYGFTAEDANSLALRFGYYKKEDYLALTGGYEMDTVSIMNDAHSQSNGVLSRIIAYYINSDECHLNIDKLINFNEQEQAKINEFETLFNEYKTLDNEKGKEKEAEAKMKEIKKALVSYAQDVNYDQDNAKSYILRTFLPAASTISQIHQYQDNIEIKLYDTKNNENVTKTIKTALFDEITMRTLVEGFNESDGIGAFDADSFLEEHGLSKTKYNLLNTDVGTSIADQSCGPQAQKLEEANTYIANQKSLDLNSEVAYAGGAGFDLTGIKPELLDNVSTAYDTATRGTYNSETIMELLNNQLKDNQIYPKNVDYFGKYAITEKDIAYRNTHGITSGKVGDIIKTVEQKGLDVTANQLSSANSTVKDHSGNTVSAEEAMDEARQEDANKTGIYDASTPEAEKKAEEQAANSQGAADRKALLQGVYDATYNYFAGSNVCSTSASYDASWATSSDAEIVYNYNLGKSDGLQWKADEEKMQSNGGGNTYGGETTIDKDMDDAQITDTEQTPVPSVDNRTDNSTSTPSIDPAPVPTPSVDPTPAPTPTPDVTPTPSTDDNTTVIDDNFINDAKKDGITIDDSWKGAEIDGDIIIGDSKTNSVSTSNEGFSSEAPSGFAPAVENVQVTETSNTYLTPDQIEDIINNMSDEELAELTATESLEETNEVVKTK